MKPKPAIIFNLNLVLIFFNLLLLNDSFVNCHFASNLFNRFTNWHSTGGKSTSLINLPDRLPGSLQNGLNLIQRKAVDFSNRTVSARGSGNYASVARRLSQVGSHAAGILEFGKLLQQLSQLDVTKLPLNAKLAKALQTLTKSKLLTGLSALNELQERYGSNHQALSFDTLGGGNLNNLNKTLVAAAALRTLLGSALTHARHSSNEKDSSDKPAGVGSLLTSFIFDGSKDSSMPSYTIEDNSVANNVIGTGAGSLSSPDYNTIKTWFLKLSQLALPDRQSALADDPKQLNAALWSLINLARYFLCKYFCSYLFWMIGHYPMDSKLVMGAKAILMVGNH